MPKSFSECLTMIKDHLIIIIIIAMSFSVSFTMVLTSELHTRDLTKRVEVLEEIVKRADQSCSILENRYNNDVNTYWNPLVEKFNNYTATTNEVINNHAKIINEHDDRITEVEGRRFF